MKIDFTRIPNLENMSDTEIAELLCKITDLKVLTKKAIKTKVNECSSVMCGEADYFCEKPDLLSTWSEFSFVVKKHKDAVKEIESLLSDYYHLYTTENAILVYKKINRKGEDCE